GDDFQGFLVPAVAFFRFNARSGRTHGRKERTLHLALKALRLNERNLFRLQTGLLQNLADSFEGDRKRLKVLGPANHLERFQPFACIDQVLRPSPKYRIDLVVFETLLLSEDKASAVQQEIKNLSFLLD